jgi:hypothetical protein
MAILPVVVFCAKLTLVVAAGKARRRRTFGVIIRVSEFRVPDAVRHEVMRR